MVEEMSQKWKSVLAILKIVYTKDKLKRLKIGL